MPGVLPPSQVTLTQHRLADEASQSVNLHFPTGRDRVPRGLNSCRRQWVGPAFSF